MAKPPPKRGRPPALNDEQIARALRLLETKTFDEVAQDLGVTRNTIYRLTQTTRQEIEDNGT